MEVVAGGNSRLDPSWWMVTAGILIFFPPPMCLAAVCNDGVGVMSCPMNELAGVNCTYVKGVPEHVLRGAPNRAWNEFPGAVRELRVEPIFRKLTDSKYGVHLNISWKLGFHGAHYYEGFLLNVTYVDKVEYNIIRTYNLAVADWSNNAIPKTAFRHECIAPMTNVWYHVEVHSLPLKTTGSKNVAVVDKRITGINSLAKSSSVGGSVDPFTSGMWSPPIWENLLPAEDGSVSVEVCFFMAPKEFNFTGYRLILRNISDAALLFSRSHQDENDTITENGDESRRACRKFDRVCTGIYEAKLLPVPSDECYFGQGNKQRCRPAVLQPIVVNSSVCSPQSKTQKIYSDDQKDEGHTLDNSQIVQLICVVMAAIALVVRYPRYY